MSIQTEWTGKLKFIQGTGNQKSYWRFLLPCWWVGAYAGGFWSICVPGIAPLQRHILMRYCDETSFISFSVYLLRYEIHWRLSVCLTDQYQWRWNYIFFGSRWSDWLIPISTRSVTYHTVDKRNFYVIDGPTNRPTAESVFAYETTFIIIIII